MKRKPKNTEKLNIQENGNKSNVKKRKLAVNKLDSDACSLPETILQRKRRILLVIGLSVPSFKQEILDQMFPKEKMNGNSTHNDGLERELIFIWYNLHDDPCAINFRGKSNWDYIFKENVSNISSIFRMDSDKVEDQASAPFGFNFSSSDEILIIMGAGASCTTFENYKQTNVIKKKLTSTSPSLQNYRNDRRRDNTTKARDDTNYPFDKEFLLSTLSCDAYFDAHSGKCLCQDNHEFLLKNTIELTAKLRYDQILFRSFLRLEGKIRKQWRTVIEKTATIENSNILSRVIQEDQGHIFKVEEETFSSESSINEEALSVDDSDISDASKEEFITKYYSFYIWLRQFRDLIYSIITFNIDSLEVHALCKDLDEVELQKNIFFIENSKPQTSKSIKHRIFQLHGNLNTLTTLNFLQEEALYHTKRLIVPQSQLPPLWNNISSLKDIYEGRYRWFELLFPKPSSREPFCWSASSTGLQSPEEASKSKDSKNFGFCFLPIVSADDSMERNRGRRTSGRLKSKESLFSDLLKESMYGRQEPFSPLTEIGPIENKGYIDKVNLLIRDRMRHLCIGNCLYNEDIGDRQLLIEIQNVLQCFLSFVD